MHLPITQPEHNVEIRIILEIGFCGFYTHSFIAVFLSAIFLYGLSPIFSELGPIKNAVTCSMTIVHRFIVRVTIKVISFCHLEKWFIPRISWLCSTIYGLQFSIICFYIGCRDTIIFEIVITKLQFHMIKIAFELTHNRQVQNKISLQAYRFIDILIYKCVLLT